MKKLFLAVLFFAVLFSATAQWTSEVEKDLLTDESTYYFFGRAKSGVNEYGRHPVLVIRYEQHDYDVYIVWGAYLDGTAKPVTVRFDQETPESRGWSLSTDGTATFWPGDDYDFVLRLMRAGDFVARVTPYRAVAITALFDMAGLREEMQKYPHLAEMFK